MAVLNPDLIKKHISLRQDFIALKDTPIDNYSIDSRSKLNNCGTLFFALHTSSGDGHRFIPELIERGVRNFVVTEVPECSEVANFYVVDDVLLAMQSLACQVRKEFSGQVMAITGSTGKTVLKEWLTQVLPHKTYVSPRSYNSQIGVALSILSAQMDADRWIIEAGISTRGEMQRLVRMINPDFAILTSITDEHSSGFANREEQYEEKLLLLSGLDENKTVNGYESGKNLKEVLAETLEKLGVDINEGTQQKLTYIRTRINVIDGIDGLTILHDEFSNNLTSLELALDFADRRRESGRPLILVLYNPDNLYPQSEIDRLKKTFNINRIVEGTDSATVLEKLKNEIEKGSLLLVKGTEQSGFRKIVAEFELKQHETVMEINLDNLVHNFNFFRSKLPSGTGICVMLKADGYGCGSLELARTLQSQGAAAIAVAVVDEGVQLREGGITLPIIVLNPRAENYGVMFTNRLEPEIYSFEILEEVVRQARNNNMLSYPVHIKLDTGMHRLGFSREEIRRAGEILASTPELRVKSVFSHLATADMPEMDVYTDRQIELFHSMSEMLAQELPYTIERHLLNTAGILRRASEAGDMVRLGLGLYGLPVLNTEEELANLRPVASLRSTIIALADRKAGDAIGYGRRGEISRDTVIATIPIGYADGILRHLGNGNAYFVVRGIKCPIVGNICMDICMIDVTKVKDVKIGDRVEIFGPEAPLTRLSDTLQTIPYEIQVSISPRVKRVYYRE